uniref:Retrotransposon gag domain-containing protein n=1 Tax=Peronospora matthiolae TaxID=2874970 RepID=A0AAV1TXU5_9STRA
MKTAFLRDQAPDDEKCLVFGDLLTGPARNWYSQLSRSTRDDWKSLSEGFMARYGGYGMSAGRQYYHARKRPNETPLEYLDRLNIAGMRAKVAFRDGSPASRLLVQLDKSRPKSWATTDPVFRGNTEPEWKEGANNELELFYDHEVHQDEAVTLTVEVYVNESGDELVGSGQLDVSAIVHKQSTEPQHEHVQLGNNRGEVEVLVWFGPPVRRAFRAAGRSVKLLDARDAVVGMMCSMTSWIGRVLSRYTQPPTDFAKKHRNLSVAVAALLGIMGAGALALFLAVAVPTMLVAFFTFPLWIIPFLVTTFFAAPLWVPILLLVGLFLLFIATFVFGLGVTSRPVRRKGAMISNKIKHSDVGKRVIYEKMA